MATKPAKKAAAKKTAPKKYNNGGAVKKTESIFERSLREREEAAGLRAKPAAKAASAPETSQYAGKKFQMSAEAKAAQEKRNKEVFERHNKK